MNLDARHRTLFIRPVWALLLALCLGLLAMGEPAFAVAAAGGTPATPVPGTGSNARWNSTSAVKPAMIIEDSTWFAGHDDPKNGDTRLFYALDIENGILFVATGQGLEIVDIRQGPTASESSYIYGYHSGGSFPGWYFAGDPDWFVTHLDAPAGNPNVLALSMDLQGFSVVNTANPAAPVVAYHAVSHAASTGQVYSARAAGTDWAYGLNLDSEVVRFNLTAASSMNRCLESPPAVVNCPGVYRGIVSAVGSGWSSIHGVGNYMATGRWSPVSNPRIKIWSLSDPGAPSQVLDSALSAMDLEMWQSGSTYYLARVDVAKKLWIHDVSCIVTGGCAASSPPVVWSQQLTSPSALRHVTVSQTAGKTYLYVGGDDLGSCVAQREYLFDVTNPASASHDDLTPKIHPAGYWGWYYQDCETGFNLVGPRIGKVYASTSGVHLYRAAMSILDAHAVGSQDVAPTANFNYSPSEIYPGDPVTFSDQSSGNPNSWVWTFQDGSPSASNAEDPVVSFSSSGSKLVTLKSANVNGESILFQKSVPVLNPAPQVASATASPTTILQCQPVTLTAGGITGQAPLSGRGWSVQAASGGSPVLSTDNPFEWTPSSNSPTGQYTATYSVSNAAGSASKSVNFTVNPVLPINVTAPFVPTLDPFTAGTVQFHVNVPNATEWSWDFDDDKNPATSNFGPWLTHPTDGPNPQHSYSTIGARTVRVKVRNCVTAEILSQDLPVNILEITPLAPLFSIAGGAICFPGTDTCSVNTGVSVSFLDASTGAEAWHFDWDGNGTYEQGPLDASAFDSHVIRHTFNTQGTFQPKLKVTRGTEEKVYQLPKQILVSQAQQQQGTIAISGSSTGTVGTAITLTATGGGSCSPSSSGWNWSLAGGTASGSVSGSSVSVSWASAGSKAVSATNSACSGVTGSKNVTISTGGGGGNGGTALKADYTYSPAAPIAGQAVSFNGGISQGGPETYAWSFGDGTPQVTSGAQVSHTFAQTGFYQVRLTISKPGTGTGCQVIPGAGSICSAEVTKAVVVTSGAPPLIASFNSDICNNPLQICSTDVGQAVTFTDSSTGNVISRVWDFGDGQTATGATVTHVYNAPGTYLLNLTISDGTQFRNFTRTVAVNGVLTESMLLPWVGKAKDGPLVQSSDLYLHNPSAETINVSLDFIQRGNVGDLPPVNRAIEPNATLFVGDVVKNMFGLDNMTGFLEVKINQGNVQPVLISFNTTVRSTGEFGQTIPGFTQSNTGAAASTGNNQVQHLVGLNDNGERLAYFGFSNAGASQVSYTLRFFNDQGAQVGRGETLTLGPLSAKQFQAREIRERFGLTDLDDYRVLVETPRNARLFPYGANVRIGSADPSFLTVGGGAARTYLLGALSTPGANNSVWQSDMVLANTGTQVAIADISFTNVGATSQPTDVIRETLQPGETRRLADVIGTKWNIRNGVGVLTIDSNAPGALYPVIQGESYENTNPTKRYGQTLPGLTDTQAAGSGKGQYLVGLREDSKYRTTFWMFNPSATEQGLYDVVFRNLLGQEVLRLPNVTLGPGKLRQLNKAQFPTVTGSFTVQVLVKSGKALAAAQVVNNVTNDPAYVQGETR